LATSNTSSRVWVVSIYNTIPVIDLDCAARHSFKGHFGSSPAIGNECTVVIWNKPIATYQFEQRHFHDLFSLSYYGKKIHRMHACDAFVALTLSGRNIL
jgi:hypothetical protein